MSSSSAAMGSGPKGEPPEYTGLDVVVVRESKIAALYVFLNPKLSSPSTSMVLLDTTDLGGADPMVSANFATMRIDARRGDEPVSARIERSAVGSLWLDEADDSFGSSYDMEPKGAILLCHVGSSGFEEKAPNQEPNRFSAGQAFAFGTHEGVRVRGAVQGVNTTNSPG